MIRKTTKRIVIHHSASPPSTTLDQIRKWHKDKGFTDAAGHSGYHYFIDGTGKVFSDRPNDEWGCAVKNANHDAVHVCLAGDFDWVIPPEAQVKALTNLLIILVKKFGLKYWNIYAHRDIKFLFIFNTTATNCCGDHLIKLLPEIRRRVFFAMAAQVRPTGVDENPKLDGHRGIPTVAAVETWWRMRRRQDCEDQGRRCSACADEACENNSNFRPTINRKGGERNELEFGFDAWG